jgi:hypothetical protein
MSKTQGRFVTLAAGALLVVAGAYHLGAARADGAPTATPLYYSGQASEAGVPITGTRNVRVSLWRDATSTDTAMRMCETVALDTAFTEGSFRIALEPACVTAVRDEPNLFVELEIAGTRIGERVALGAVPYALEADHALIATRATDATAGSALARATVPAGAVMAFDLDACPAGWTEYTAAQGRAIIGATTELTRGSPVGNRTITLTPSQLPPHTHSNVSGTGTVGGPLPTIGSNAPTATFSWATDEGPGTSAPIDILGPSVPLLYCRKS